MDKPLFGEHEVRGGTGTAVREPRSGTPRRESPSSLLAELSSLGSPGVLVAPAPSREPLSRADRAPQPAWEPAPYEPYTAEVLFTAHTRRRGVLGLLLAS